ncbi:MAG: hypothetical protein PHO46_01170 [Thermoguttaceae bacterium]|jgi:hypothetical protein|nr:hypothetical protein [Thermoguttaceae bacterium]
MTTAELIEKIKRILVDPEGLTREDLEALASEYASRCRRLNAKLDRAVACIRSGQLCEAERLERDGKLIDEIQALSFPNADLWRAVCRGAGCDVTAQVSADAATELQLFILDFEGVANVFRQYRRLSLEVAPAKDRLDLLYQLRAKFPKTPTIDNTVAALEKERIEQISEQLKSMDPKNPPKEFILETCEELENPVRTTPAPEQMLQNLRAWRDYINNMTQIEQLKQFVIIWAEAKYNNDEKRMIACLAQYRSSNYAEFLNALSAEEREALDVLSREAQALERKKTAQAELKRKTTELARAAQTTHDVDKLSNLIASAELVAENAEQSVDHKVATAAAQRIESLQLQQSRRSTFLVVSAAVIVFLFSAAVLYSIHRAQFLKDASLAAAEIEGALDEFVETKYDTPLETARKKVEDYTKKRPKFQSVQAFDEAVVRYRKISEEEERRAFEFDKNAKLILENLEAGYPHDPTSLEKRLARSVEDQRRCQDLRTLYTDVLLAYNDNRAEKNQDLLNLLDKKLQDTLALPAADRRGAIAEIRTQIALFKNSPSGEEQDRLFIQQLDALNNELDALSEQTKRARKAADITGELQEAIGVSSRYNATLDRLKETLDEADVKLADLAARDVDNASRAKVWNSFLADASSPLAWTKDAAAFEKIDAKAEGAEDALAFAPEYNELADRIETWRPFAEAGGFAAMRDALKKAVEPYATPLWLYHNAKSDQYVYLTSKPESAESKGIERADGAETRKYDVSKLTDEEIAGISEACQYALYQKVNSAKVDDDPTALFKLYSTLIRETAALPETAVDPLLKAKLLSELLKPCKDCPGLLLVNERFEVACEDSKLDFEANFYDNTESKEQREAAVKLLADFGAINKALDSAEKNFEDAIKPIQGYYEWVGYIDVADGEAQVFFGPARPKDGQTLWVARGTDASAVECGEVVGTKGELNLLRDWEQYRWTLVYARSDAAE